MNKLVLLFLMLFLHIVDDYYLQSILASMKQRRWWEDNYPENLYRYDYIAALLEHGYSWTFVVHIPIFTLWCLGKINPSVIFLLGFFILHWLLHSFIDHLKANEKSISLVYDQIFHVTQVLTLWFAYIL